MYVILTSKAGLFRTEIVDGLRPLQALTTICSTASGRRLS